MYKFTQRFFVLILSISLLCFGSGCTIVENDEVEKVISEAFKNKQSNLQVQGVGQVIRILEDDTKGSRHQRFILALKNGHTLLIAHNIDLAPRVEGLKTNDLIEFYGEYEWNDKGGVIHWTHHDPENKHPDGWLKHNNQIYQ